MLMTMQGKVCLITGGTNGIGKSAAQGLARLGATVVIVGRIAMREGAPADHRRHDQPAHGADSISRK